MRAKKRRGTPPGHLILQDLTNATAATIAELKAALNTHVDEACPYCTNPGPDCPRHYIPCRATTR